jgi:ribosomal-protein-serine acetyltransferase
VICQLVSETLDAQRLHIECDAENYRGASVARRLGFTQEGVLRNERRDSLGKLQNTLQFAMIPDDYQIAKEQW